MVCKPFLCLVLWGVVNLSFPFLAICHQSSSEVQNWRQEYGAVIDGAVNPNAYSGGVGLARPAFVDIDDDGKEDMFTGTSSRRIYFYKKMSSGAKPEFSLITTNFESIEVQRVTAPAFADIDGDGDLDLCIGQAEGDLTFFINHGSKKEWKFERADREFDLQTIDVGFQCAPALADIDGDGDLDLTLGNSKGDLTFYKNVGSRQRPRWRLVKNYFKNIELREWSTPVFVDIDVDSDLDFFSGSKLGKIFSFQNKGTEPNPCGKKSTTHLNLSEQRNTRFRLLLTSTMMAITICL